MVQREGYYDYMLRRYREEQDKTAEKKWDYENPLLRAKIGDLEAQIDIMKKDHISGKTEFRNFFYSMNALNF